MIDSCPTSYRIHRAVDSDISTVPMVFGLANRPTVVRGRCTRFGLKAISAGMQYIFDIMVDITYIPGWGARRVAAMGTLN